MNRHIEAVALDNVERRERMTHLWYTMTSDALSDGEMVALLMYLDGHGTHEIARVCPRADGGEGVTRQRVHMLINQALDKLAARGFDTSPGMGGQGRRRGRSPLKREVSR